MMKRFSKYHLPAILYAALILVLSSLPGLGVPQIKIVALDKVIHFIEYAIFAVLIYRSFSNLSDKLQGRIVVFFSMLFVVLFALFDELYQSYIPGRQSDPFDFSHELPSDTCQSQRRHFARGMAHQQRVLSPLWCQFYWHDCLPRVHDRLHFVSTSQ